MVPKVRSCRSVDRTGPWKMLLRDPDGNCNRGAVPGLRRSSTGVLTAFMVRNVLSSFLRFSLSARSVAEATFGLTLGLLLSLRRRPPGRRPSFRRVVRPFRQALWAWLPRGWHRVDDVGLSPVRVISHCARVKPPNTSNRLIESPYLSTSKSAGADPALHHTPELGAEYRPKRDSSFAGPSWSLSPFVTSRRRHRLTDGELQTDFPDGYGPARVGFGSRLCIMRAKILTVQMTEPTTPAAHAECGALSPLLDLSTFLASKPPAPQSADLECYATSPR